MNREKLFKLTENATIEISIQSDEELHSYIQKIELFCNLGFQRFIFECDGIFDSYCIKSINEIANKHEATVFFKYSFNGIDLARLDHDILYIISSTPTVFSDYMKYDNAFFELCYDERLIPRVVELATQYENILLSPQGDLTDLNVYDALVNSILRQCAGTTLQFTPFLLPVDLIREHPCNIYLCGNNFCHSNHGGYPRHIKILHGGEIYMNYSDVYLGNLNEGELEEFLSTVASNKAYISFIDASKKTYLEIIDRYFYSTIAWFEWVKKNNV